MAGGPHQLRAQDDVDLVERVVAYKTDELALPPSRQR